MMADRYSGKRHEEAEFSLEKVAPCFLLLKIQPA
jgi:hypothetical protein